MKIDNGRVNGSSAIGFVFVHCLLVACASDPGAPVSSNVGVGNGGKAGVAGASSAGHANAGSAGLGSAGSAASGSSGSSGASSSGAGASSASSGSAGANAAGATASGIEPSFATVKLVFGGGGGIESCAAAPCHGVGGNAPPGNPVTLADNEQLYANLTSYVSRACENLKLVSPGKPDESALLKILTGPCGATPQMPNACKPADGTCIPADYVAAIREWITNGAPKQ